MNIGKNILKQRRAKSVTQEELAAELGVTAAAVSKWENGNTLPDILMLGALADYFGVTTDELLGRSTLGKFAAIAAGSPELAAKIETLAGSHGLVTAAVCPSYEAALEAAARNSHIRYILVSCGEPLTKLQWDATPEHLCVLDSPNETEERILAGFRLFLGKLDI